MQSSVTEIPLMYFSSSSSSKDFLNTVRLFFEITYSLQSLYRTSDFFNNNIDTFCCSNSLVIPNAIYFFNYQSDSFRYKYSHQTVTIIVCVTDYSFMSVPPKVFFELTKSVGASCGRFLFDLSVTPPKRLLEDDTTLI